MERNEKYNVQLMVSWEFYSRYVFSVILFSTAVEVLMTCTVEYTMYIYQNQAHKSSRS